VKSEAELAVVHVDDVDGLRDKEDDADEAIDGWRKELGGANDGSGADL